MLSLPMGIDDTLSELTQVTLPRRFCTLGDDVRLSHLEPRGLTARAWGRAGADVRPLFEKAAMGA
jgi:hypothetical protein